MREGRLRAWLVVRTLRNHIPGSRQVGQRYNETVADYR